MAGEAVLVVETEDPSREFLAQQLTDDGFEVFATDGAGRALELLEATRPDLVLLDAVLPDASGFEVCTRLREGEIGRRWNRDVPVIMVSARGDPVDRVRGFARGADDYVVRPFVYEELVARMRAVLRRSNGPRHARLVVQELEIDLASRVVRVGGEAVQLSAKEYELLVALAEDPERVFRKEELLRDVWNFRSLGSKQPMNPTRAAEIRPIGLCGGGCVPRRAVPYSRWREGRVSRRVAALLHGDNPSFRAVRAAWGLGSRGLF